MSVACLLHQPASPDTLLSYHSDLLEFDIYVLLQDIPDNVSDALQQPAMINGRLIGQTFAE